MKISLTSITEHGDVDTIDGETTLSAAQLAHKLDLIAHPRAPRPKPRRVAVPTRAVAQLQDHTITPMSVGFRRGLDSYPVGQDGVVRESETPILDAISADGRRRRTLYWGQAITPDDDEDEE